MILHLVNFLFYSAMDDFSEDYDWSDTSSWSNKYKTRRCYTLKFVQIVSSSVFFPNPTICEGPVVGDCSFVMKSIIPLGVFAVIPVRRLRGKS